MLAAHKMKMVSGQPRLGPRNSWLWVLLVATGAALKLAGRISRFWGSALSLIEVEVPRITKAVASKQLPA